MQILYLREDKTISEDKYKKIARIHKEAAKQKLIEYAAEHRSDIQKGPLSGSMVSEDGTRYSDGNGKPVLMARKKVLINKYGGGSGKGTLSHRLTIPPAMIERLGVTAEDRDVLLTMDGDRLIIEKAKGGDLYDV